jgi:hypothetical protein
MAEQLSDDRKPDRSAGADGRECVAKVMEANLM